MLAKRIYEDQQFDLLPCLGNHLEQAGCSSAELLDHCRTPGEHVPGCWALDLVLGKEALVEEEWLASRDPEAMLDHVLAARVASPRKLWLFGSAAWRRFEPNPVRKVDLEWWQEMASRILKEMDIAERFADGEASEAEILACEAIEANGSAASFARLAAHVPEGLRLANARKVIELADLLREIFGNPHRSRLSVQAYKLAPSVTELARSIYRKRHWNRMPELGDTLLSAGYPEIEVIDHCRQGKLHVRGCWALDLILDGENGKG
jgi:hypothetical protein